MDRRQQPRGVRGEWLCVTPRSGLDHLRLQLCSGTGGFQRSECAYCSVERQQRYLRPGPLPAPCNPEVTTQVRGKASEEHNSVVEIEARKRRRYIHDQQLARLANQEELYSSDTADVHSLRNSCDALI